jgi:hypothetical protein
LNKNSEEDVIENRSKSQSKKSYSFKEAEKHRKVQKRVDNLYIHGNDDPLKATQNFTIHEKNDLPNPVLENYFMVSSHAFLDRSRFPEILMGDKKVWKIKTDILDFRINDAWAKSKNIDKKEQPTDKFFFFRLSGLNLYYSNTKTDINILGAISVKSIERIELPKLDATTEYITTCFVINDVERQHYKLCGLNELTVKHWYCQIRSFLDDPDLAMCTHLGGVDTKVITKTVEITQPIIVIPLASAHCNEKWNYQKFGEDWECDCSEGKEQSPIDIPHIDKTIQTDVAPLFRYKQVKATDVPDTIDGNLI